MSTHSTKTARGRLDVPLETLVRWSQTGDQEAKDELVRRAMSLIAGIARPQVTPLLPLEDLLQDGVLGLLQAAAAYDETRGVTFATHATYWIRKAVLAARLSQGSLIGLTKRSSRAIQWLLKGQDRFSEQHFREPTDEELASFLGASEQRIRDVRRILPQTVSDLDAIYCTGESSVHHLVDRQAAMPADELVDDELRAVVAAGLDRLTADERNVIELRYGLAGRESLGWPELAAALERSAEWCRQRQRSALRKLRHPRTTTPLRG